MQTGGRRRRAAGEVTGVGGLWAGARGSVAGNGERWWVPGVAYLALLAGLLWIQLSVPEGYAEQWAGASRLPRQSVRVSALYREAYGTPRLPLSPRAFYLAHLGLSAALWGAYVLAVRAAGRSGRRTASWAPTVAAVLVCAAMPPLYSTDVYYYAVTGEIAGEYGGNPYIQPPRAFPQSELLPYVYWTDFPSPYGPIWTAVSAGIARLSPDDSVLIAVLLFKLLAGACVLAGAWLIARLARGRGGGGWGAVALWAWNPLVLLEGPANGHNDLLVAVIALAAALLLGRGPSVWSWLLLCIAALVKLTTAPPLAVYAAWRLLGQRPAAALRRLIAYAALLGGAAALAYLPYWEGAATLGGLVSQPRARVQGAVAALAYHGSRLLAPDRVAERVAQGVFALAALCLAAWMGREWLRARGDGEGTARDAEVWLWGFVLCALPLVFVRAYPWYEVPGLALLAAAWPHRRRATLALYALSGLWFVTRYAISPIG